METKRIKTFRTRLSKKSYEELINIAVKQYKNIIKLNNILDGKNDILERKTDRIMFLSAKLTDSNQRRNKIETDTEALRIRVENAEKTNAELYVKINEKDATINKLQIAMYSMAIVICALIGYIIC